MSTVKRPTQLMADTPSMSWTYHVEASRKSKLAVAAVAVGLLCAVAGVIIGMAVFS